MSAIQTSATGVTGILADHSHEYLGAFKDFEKARRVGTLYAKKWLEGNFGRKRSVNANRFERDGDDYP